MASRTTCATCVRSVGGVSVLTGLLLSCLVTMAPPPAAPVRPPPVEPDRSETSTSYQKPSLALDLRMYVVRNDRKQRIATGDQLISGDDFELLIRPNQPAFVYLVQGSSTGEISTLFPSQGDELLSGEREYRMPADPQVWYRVAGDEEEENLYVLMARDPISDLKKLLPHVGEPAATPVLVPPALATDSIASPRRPDTKLPQVPRLRGDRVLKVSTRVVVQVRKDGAVTATVPVGGSDSDSILVRQLHFGRK